MSRPSASLNIAYVDLYSMDLLEKKFYGGSQVSSMFCKTIVKTNWYTHFTIPVKPDGQANTPSWRIPRSVDFNMYNFIINQTPDLKVKDPTKYRIAFTRNLGHNIVKESNVTFSDLPNGQSYDSVLLDNWASHAVQPGKWKVYNKMIGNITQLVEFSDHLPSKPIITLCPDYFEDDGYSLPMNCLRLNEVKKNFVLVDDWSKLLRVEMAVTDPSTGAITWVPQQANKIVFSNIIEGDLTLKMPQFFAQCALVTDEETKWYKKQTLEFMIRQYGRHTAKKDGAGIHTFNFTMHNSVKAIFFNAVNKDSQAYNIYSNYTTNPIDYDGNDPIVSVSLQYDGQPKFDNFPANIFSDIYPFKHATRCPQEAGYHFLPFCNKLNSLDADGSTNFDKIDTTFSMNVSDDPEEEGNTTKSTYCVEVRWAAYNYIHIKNDVLMFPSLEDTTQ
jgi:hypothetical protein